MNVNQDKTIAFARKNSRVLVGSFAAFLLGNLAHSLSPIMVGALVTTLGYTKSVAGYVVSAEFIGIALVSLVVAPRVHRISKRNAAIMGCIAALCVHVVCIFVSSYNLLLGLRLLAGLFEGIGLAAGSAAVAAAISPDRMYALVKTGNALVMAAMALVSGVIVGVYGVSGAWSVLALFTALLLPLLFMLPHKIPEKAKDQDGKSMPHPVQGCMAVGGLIIWLSGSGFCYIYNSFIAEQSGFDIQNFSVLLAIGKVTGMCGGLAAASIGVKYGRKYPLILGIGINAVTWMMMAAIPNPTVYVVGLLLNYVSYFFVLPYVLGTAASIDKEGSWAAVASTMLLASLAISPVVGGILIERFGIVGVGVGSLVFEFLGLFLLLFANSSIKRVKANGVAAAAL